MSYWLVRANWGGWDKKDEFINNNEWINGYDDGKFYDIVNRVQINDILLFAENSTITYYGLCTENFNDGKKLAVDKWISLNPKIDFPATGSYIKTIVRVNNTDLIKKANFAIENIIKGKKVNQIINILQNKKQIILLGAPGTGKTHTAKEVACQILGVEKEDLENYAHFKIVQFHPAYSYEDFVRGIVTNVVDGKIEYKVENKILAEIAGNATKNEEQKYILIIDEINRANLPAVLGELIYALEYRGKTVESIYKIAGSNKIVIPDNLLIIGTMNTADRSAGSIDYAIRRRFSFIPIKSDKSIIETVHKANSVDNVVTQKALAIYDAIEKIFDDKDKLNSDFLKDDLMIGHSYFLVKDADELQAKLDFEIKPLLFEYEKDGILLNANSEISALSL